MVHNSMLLLSHFHVASDAVSSHDTCTTPLYQSEMSLEFGLVNMSGSSYVRKYRRI